MRFNYPACFESSKPKGPRYVASDLSDCHTEGDHFVGAANMAAEGIELVIEPHIGNGFALREVVSRKVV